VDGEVQGVVVAGLGFGAPIDGLAATTQTGESHAARGLGAGTEGFEFRALACSRTAGGAPVDTMSTKGRAPDGEPRLAADR